MFFDKYELIIGEGKESPFMNKHGVYQDGTTPMYRDTDGRLWAMMGIIRRRGLLYGKILSHQDRFRSEG